jgi:uncharacterized coiled-coil protein SlyX
VPVAVAAGAGIGAKSRWAVGKIIVRTSFLVATVVVLDRTVAELRQDVTRLGARVDRLEQRLDACAPANG